MENEQRRKCSRFNEVYELKLSDLLPHLGRRRQRPGQHVLQTLSQRSACSSPPPRSKAGDAPVSGGGALVPPLLDIIQRLAEHQSLQHCQQITPSSPTSGSQIGQTTDPEQRTKAFSKASTELFFLPYIAAGRAGVPRTESPASIRKLFQQGALSSQILGMQACANRNHSTLWQALKEPFANSGTSERYFENLEDLQRKLYKGVLQRSDGLLRHHQDLGSQRRALRSICLSDSSMCCSPPLVCRNQIYYKSFSE